MFQTTSNHYLLRMLIVFVIALPIVLCLLLTILGLLFPDARLQKYLSTEIPLIKAEAEKLQGVSVSEVVDIGPPDEVNVYVTFDIQGKGTLTLDTPTAKIFITGETIFIKAIGDCQLSITSSPPGYLRFNLLSEVIEKYDEIYAQVKQVSKYGNIFGPVCKESVAPTEALSHSSSFNALKITSG